MKDIAIRHAFRDVNSLRQLTAFLITNIGNLVSASKLVGMFDIKSPNTFLEYFSFLKDAYLIDFVPIFNHSLKVQARNPKKIYVMDMGLYTENAVSLSYLIQTCYFYLNKYIKRGKCTVDRTKRKRRNDEHTSRTVF